MKLSNNHGRWKVINLDPTDPKRGPFVVTQVAIDPEDPSLRERTYLLRRDGVWIEHVTHALMEEEQRVKVVFDSMAHIGQLMDNLQDNPAVHPQEEIDQSKLSVFLAKVEAEGGMLAHIKANVRIYKGR